MKISITQRDIDKGVSRTACLCPVALALFRETGKQWEVLSDRARELRQLGETVRFPAELEAWIVAYDRGRECGPFECEVLL